MKTPGPFAALALVSALAASGSAEARVARGVHVDGVVVRHPPRAAPVAPGRAGELVVVPGRSRPSSAGRVLRFAVEVEGGLPVDRAAFAARVTAVLADRRSWRVAMQRVSSGRFDFRVTLAGPATTDRLCAPLPTNGLFSCAQDGRAVLNADRWLRGAETYRRALGRYRVYMVNHEVGHLLGRGHAYCGASGSAAPVMMQQTKGLEGCRPNAWPLAWER